VKEFLQCFKVKARRGVVRVGVVGGARLVGETDADGRLDDEQVRLLVPGVRVRRQTAVQLDANRAHTGEGATNTGDSRATVEPEHHGIAFRLRRLRLKEPVVEANLVGELEVARVLLVRRGKVDAGQGRPHQISLAGKGGRLAGGQSGEAEQR